MQILQCKSAISDLPMSNAARKQLGLYSEELRNINKHKHLPTHNLNVGQNVIFQDAGGGIWLL